MSKKLRVVGVDMGNYNVKTYNKVLFKAVYEEYDYKNELLNDDILVYGDRRYVIGKGTFDNTKVKSQKKNPIPLFLNGLYESLNGAEYAILRVILGLPLSQHQNKEIVQEIKDMYKKDFEFKRTCNGLNKDIYYSVQEVFVLPECMGAFYSLKEDVSDRDVLVIDLGGGTTNIALFIDGEYVDSVTIENGTTELLRQVKDMAIKGKKGAAFTQDDMEKYMKRGKIKWDGEIDNMEYVPKILSDFVSEIMNVIKGKFPLYKSYDIKLSGGGVDILKDEFDKHIDFDVIPDNIFANAIGFYNVGVDMDE